MIPAPKNALVSFHYFGKGDLDRLAGLRVIGDSGAYSAKMQGAEIKNDELAEWIHKWKHRLIWAAALDVAGNTKLTRANWLTLMEQDIPVAYLRRLHKLTTEL